jgi:hypothetical protein
MHKDTVIGIINSNHSYHPSMGPQNSVTENHENQRLQISHNSQVHNSNKP